MVASNSSGHEVIAKQLEKKTGFSTSPYTSDKFD
jgi:hypothetical protein